MKNVSIVVFVFCLALICAGAFAAEKNRQPVSPQNTRAISSEPVYSPRSLGPGGDPTKPNTKGTNPLAISNEPVYAPRNLGGGGDPHNPAASGNPLAISSEPVYRGQGGAGNAPGPGSIDPNAISSEPVYRGGAEPGSQQN